MVAFQATEEEDTPGRICFGESKSHALNLESAIITNYVCKVYLIDFCVQSRWCIDAGNTVTGSTLNS